MEDSIINIDECESLSLSSDTDIKSIVDQWKRKNKVPEIKDLNNFDTRTFTRPKKKLFSGANVNGISHANNTFNDDSSDDQATTSRASIPKIDLKIGGLVTSMQRSYLGDVSPPSNMESSIEPMGNSLITSMDFSNVNEFINGNDDSLSLANFNQYRLTDAINDRNFLERLTNYDESLFTKDADINNIDGNHLISNGTLSSNSTLQNSTDSTKNDDTFVAMGQMNGTFNAVGEVDRTFIQAPGDSSSLSKNGTFEIVNAKNETFDARNGTFDAKNGTFDAKNGTFDAKNGTFDAKNETFDAKKALSEFNKTTDALDDEELSLYGTFKVEDDGDDFKKPEGFGMTMTRQRSPKVDLNSTVTKGDLEEFQSTPARRDAKKKRQSVSLANISPILVETAKPQNSLKNVEQFVDVEIEDFPVLMRQTPPRSIDRQTSNPTGVNYELREKQRQSLANFEEFENTLLILENNKTEEEFDDLLNSFNTKHRNPLSDKVRQSLDNIKKRHSFMGMEKQQQDELNREKTMNVSQNEKNRINESFNRTTMMSSTSSTGSGGGERLLRRSRLFDDVINTSGSSTDELHKSSSGSSIGVNDNNRQMDTTEVLNKKNQSRTEEENTQLKTDHTMIYNNTNEIKTECKPNGNRDRFKTIRIFKKPPENAIQIPDADEPNAESSPSLSQPLNRTVDVFATKNTNSPKLAAKNMNNNEEYLEQNTGSQKAINTMTFKRSAMTRPKQLSGLNMRELYVKSNSHEHLSRDDQTSQPSKIQPTKTISQLKSPMGVKSKSIHNLTSVRSSFAAPSKLSAQPAGFKVPATKPMANLRSRNDFGQPKKLSLIRPSSGYYGYNTKRMDSDTESVKFSSNNSLSSASSRSSASRGETPETYIASNQNPNSTFVQPQAKAVNVPSSSSSITSSNIQSKLSLLRPPTQIRKSGLPRPSAFSAKR